jgi:hypothetical protein
MGASWRRLGAAALLLVLAAALAAPAGWAGSAADPEVSDAAGDQAIDRGDVPVLPVPGINDDDFGDIDVVAAYVGEFGNLTRITVQTTEGWTTGSMVLAFTVSAGPTSLPGSTASGQAFTVFVNGTAVAGINGSAAATTDGLRIDLPTAALGATGGDLLSGLSLNTSRTDAGNLGLAQDDQTGADMAGPGRDYTFTRPPVSPRLDLAVLSVGGKAGAFTTDDDAKPVPVVLRISNLGIDADAWQLSLSSQPPLKDPPAFAQAFTPIEGGATAETTVPISLAGMAEGPIQLTFSASSELGSVATATATITLDLPSSPPADREVKPAGLTFLTSGAEAMGLDDAFGSYGEAFLLALIVLLTILAIFLLLALGRSTTKGEPAAEAPWPAGAGATPTAFAGPGGLSETVRASPARSAPPPVAARAREVEAEEAEGEDEAEEAPLEFAPPPPAPLATAPAGARIRIEEVRHTPREPEAGQGVTTEVLLRNDGPTATLRIALSVDGKPVAERTVQVASRATKAVELPWTAGAGDNRVRIQAFPA